MDTFRFVHAANLLLDRPFAAFPSPPRALAETLRDASLDAWDALVQLSIDCAAAALLLGGRLYDGAAHGRRAQIRFRQGLERLSVRGIPVFLSLTEEEEGLWDVLCEWPPGVTVFSSSSIRSVELIRSGHLLARVHGCGAMPPDVAVLLSESVRERSAVPLSIALLSGEPNGALVNPPSDVGYYALASRLDWQIAQRDPWIVEPGTTQGRGFAADQLGPKGAAIVEVAAGRVVDVSFAPLDRARLLRIDLDAGAESELAQIEADLSQRAEDARAQHAGVPLVLTARVSGNSLSGLDGEARRATLLERLRDRSTDESFWWAAVQAVPRAPQMHAASATSVPLASIILEQSDALLGAALPRSSFLARCFQPLMNVCDAEIGLGEIRDLLRESAALAIGLLAHRPSGTAPDHGEAAPSPELPGEHAAGLTVVQIGAAERKASVLASMQKSLFGGAAGASSRLESDRESGIAAGAAGSHLKLAGAVNGDAPSAATEIHASRNGPSNDVFRAVFVVDAKSVRAPAPVLAAALISRPAASIATRAQRQIEHALAALDKEAGQLLGDGKGRIDRILAARSAVEEALHDAREAELQRVVLLGHDEIRTIESLRARETLAARRSERETLSWLLRISPPWQERRDLLAAIEAIRPPEPELLAGFDALQTKLSAGRTAVRTLRWRRDHLRHEFDALDPDARMLAVSERARRLAEQVSAYRDDLSLLAARRAHCQELETALAKGLDLLQPGLDRQRLNDFDPDALDHESLDQWNSRYREAVARRSAAAAEERAAQDSTDALSAEIAQRLEEPPADDEGDLDRQWRSLWRLRRAQDELWVVQSEAEAKARAVREREESLAKLTPSGGSGSGRSRVWVGIAVGISLAALFGFGFLEQFVRAAYAAFAAVALLLLDVLLGVRRQAASTRQGRQKVDEARIRREIERTRLERDVAWLRAADLQEQVAANAAVLSLASMPPIESVDAREQLLAQQAAAASESEADRETLSGRTLELLAREERARALTAEREKVLEEESSIGRGWEAWRAEAGLPEGLDVLDAPAWLAEVRRLRGVAAQLVEASEDLRGIEPRIAVWEGGVRFTLAQNGVNITNDLCGNLLVEEIRSLNARVTDAEARTLRRSQVESEREDVEQRLTAAGEEVAAGEREMATLLGQLGVAREEDVGRLRADLQSRQTMQGFVERCDQTIGALLAEARVALVGDRRSTIEEQLEARLAGENADGWAERARQIEEEIEAAERAPLESEDEPPTAWQSLGEATQIPTLELEYSSRAAELESAARRWRVLAVGRGLLEEASRELEREQRRSVLVDASTIFASLTGGRFGTITFDETGTGLALQADARRRVRLNGQVDADAAAHLALSIRLAIARHVSQEAVACPLMVDDLLQAFGEREQEGVAAQLVAFARGQQVLYFTCDRSSWNHLSRLDAGARLIET